MIKKYSIGILLIIGLLFICLSYSAILYSSLFHESVVLSPGLLWFSRITIWISLIILLVYVYVFEKGYFLLWENKKYNFLSFLKKVATIYFLTIFISLSIKFILNKIIGDENATGKMLLLTNILNKNFILLIFTCATAGITEELIFRGYIQSRLEKIYNNPLVGIVASSLLFGILHATYHSYFQVISPFIIGVIFSYFYKKYRNIYLLIVVHFLFDFLFFLPHYF